MNTIKVLELFAGSRSFSKVAEEFGYKAYCTDFKSFNKIDQVCDIFDNIWKILKTTNEDYNFDINKLREEFGEPDIIWASPPCTTFSVASIGHHWKGGNRAYIPKTEKAKVGIKMVQKTLDIINELNPKYYYIENPRGLLRKLPVIKSVALRRTVCYCKYGENRMKPTDIWTNDFKWIPREMCFNGNVNCHHEPAPRGSRTGTQGLKGNYNRSIVPYELCKEIIGGVLS